ncbi:MarR family winged helix-turn-helix transcriptional regulator [Spirilliplanes yamanashiensis]|uniref:MarR family transcriptional regulator n=1 Tax=Spirilliplanes yamanashiensis TaxID=42233 RepID=A0A8J3YCL4_9ACTN|nr:MarR family transcriptional regulator [Spirilliplanes yamanashiensis]MDP9818843.1 DNA-binding MarR family transcriptional regulator [Spirilliplanes yamanashiensis]GIJ05297.1 MarR family transcriptional regulator [Spirilliplanes yamanashiensis]
MERVTDHAAAVESAVESLLAVLDAARLAQSPAVPPTQLRVLLIVAAAEQTNMNRLAEALDVVPSSASRLCDRLEATGLLRRVVDPRDRREVRLELTPASRQLLDDLRERRRLALAEVLDRMPPGARQDLVRALQAFDAAARRDEPAEPGLRTA